MDTEQFVAELDRYTAWLTEVASCFTSHRTGSTLDVDSIFAFKQCSRELVDLLNDYGAADAARQIFNEYLEAINSYSGPSPENLAEIIALVRAVKTRALRALAQPNHPEGTALDDVWNLIHPTVVALSKPRFDAGHFADAVEAALKELNSEVKKLHRAVAGEELDGVPLMQRALAAGKPGAPAKPTIVLDDLATDSGYSIQQGYMFLFSGAMLGIRNPKAHENVTITAERAIHLLMLASLLFSKLAERRSP